jgi:hypothetical protein
VVGRANCRRPVFRARQNLPDRYPFFASVIARQ